MLRLDAVYAAALEFYAGTFEATRLMAEAEQVTGLCDWGGEGWAEGRFRARLGALCRGLEGEAQLHAVGRSRAHSRLHVLLGSRLRQVEYHGRLGHRQPITAPLVGTGLPRAGTTFLHGLLGCDPRHRVATAAQAAIPVPPPGQYAAAERDRTAFYQRILAFQGFTAPDVTAIHPYAAGAPEESVFLQEGACGTPLGAFYNAPAFAALATTAEGISDSYAWQKRMMQTLQGDQPSGRWLLKAPSHAIQIDALFAVFPDALVFINHRDPGKVIPSMASLYMKLYSLASAGSVDPQMLGPRLVANWSGILDRLDDWRAAHPQVRIVDVHYGDLIVAPIVTARRLYTAFGLHLPDVAQRAMAAHLETDNHGKAPARPYGLADFGLREADIEDAFGAYIERHGVTREVRT